MTTIERERAIAVQTEQVLRRELANLLVLVAKLEAEVIVLRAEVLERDGLLPLEVRDGHV
jgi:hypothetical protein